MKKIFLLIIPIMILASCTAPTTPASCNSASGTSLCFGGEPFSFGDVYWKVVSNHIEIHLEPQIIPGTTTRAVGVIITLNSSAIDTSHVPYVGSYVNAFDASSSTLQFYVVVQDMDISSSNTTTYISDTTITANVLNITAFASNILSGNGNLKVVNQSNTSEQKEVIVSFENLPVQ